MRTINKRSSRHKVDSLFKTLREQIVSGSIADGEALPAPEIIADENGVSVITIKRIMAKLADEGLVNRVRGQGTFARSGSHANKHLNIGIIDSITSPNSTDLQKVMAEISTTCAELLNMPGVCIHRISYGDMLSPERVSEVLSQLDAMLIGCSHFDERTRELIDPLPIPKVMYGNEFIHESTISQVIPDFNTAMPYVTQYLADNAFQEIIIVHEDHNNARIRSEAFRSAVINAGYPLHLITELTPQSMGQSDGGYRLASQLFKTPAKRFIFSSSDFVSFGIVDAMHDLGIIPGGDTQLLSSDNLEGHGVSIYPHPLLSSIDPEHLTIAAKAVELLHYKINNPDPCQYIIKVPSRLVIRKTATINSHKES
jgi:DNA-binding LacI/PurR family transcriptional regulator